jgi:hypothetical protein
MNFFVEFFTLISEMLQDWPVGTLIGLLLAFVTGLAAVIVLYGIFLAVDSWFRPTQKGIGIVTGKKFIPAHTDMILIDNMPYYTHYNDEWRIGAKVGRREGSISVRKSFYDQTSRNQQVRLWYTHGRLSGSLYIKGIAPA